jgi:hypothetical protein
MTGWALDLGTTNSALAGGEAGRLSVADDEAGRLSLSDTSLEDTDRR